MNDDNSARSIEDLQDVDAVLKSAAASFTELMECVAVCRVYGEWDLRIQAAERAFDQLEVDRKIRPDRMEQATEMVVASYLARAVDLDDLKSGLATASSWLATKRAVFERKGLQPKYDEHSLRLAELLVLLAQSDTASLTQLCSRLRKVERSDLAVTVGNRARDSDPDNVVVLTTLGAALCDIGEFGEAEQRLRSALQLDPSNAPARTALSRVLSFAGQPVAAFENAMAAFRGNPAVQSARRLVAAASKVDDQDAIDEALSVLDEAVGEQRAPSTELALLAAEVMFEQGHLERARDLVDAVMKGESTSGQTAQQLVELKRKVFAEPALART